MGQRVEMSADRIQTLRVSLVAQNDLVVVDFSEAEVVDASLSSRAPSPDRRPSTKDGKPLARRSAMQGREEPTLDVLELDRVAWNLPVASKRPSPSHPQRSRVRARGHAPAWARRASSECEENARRG